MHYIHKTALYSRLYIKIVISYVFLDISDIYITLVLYGIVTMFKILIYTVNSELIALKSKSILLSNI